MKTCHTQNLDPSVHARQRNDFLDALITLVKAVNHAGLTVWAGRFSAADFRRLPPTI